MNINEWFRTNVMQYFKQFKAWVTGEIDTAKTELRQEMSSFSVTGAFKGGFSTVSEMPSRAKNGDWAVLTTDDGSNESGIYVKGGGGWSFVADIASFDEVQALLATDDEFTIGTATQKAVTVKQLTNAFNTTITDEEVLEDWNSV